MTKTNTDNAFYLDSLQEKALFEKRVIFFSEPVTSKTASKLIEKLLALDSKGHDPIFLYLNSPGGEVDTGFGIYDVIRYLDSEVKIIVSGLAASIATIILLASKQKNRLSLPNSRFLIHQPLISGTFRGSASDIEIQAEEMLKTREKIVDMYVKETKKTKARILKDIDRDYWMSSEEALSYGLISKVISNKKELL